MLTKPGKLSVAVGVLENVNGEVLISKRQAHQQHAGLWEFPGGKIKNKENVRSALHRELMEELHISVLSSRPLIQINYDYPDSSVTLHVYRVTDWQGNPVGREGQEIEWVAKTELEQQHLLDANKNIVRAIQLPEIMSISPEPESLDQDIFLTKTENMLRNGIKLIQFRSKKRDAEYHSELIHKMVQLCKRHKAKLILNSSIDEELIEISNGLHLSSERLNGITNRPIPDDKILTVSCHKLEEIKQAERVEADAIVLGSVFETQSHPGVSAMGWEFFSTLTATTNVPVYAIGGMTRKLLPVAWDHGAQGVAMISALWQ